MMSRIDLVRLGGFAAALGGALAAVVNAANSALILSTGRPLAGVAYGILGPFLDLSGLFVAALFLAGLVGLYASLGARSAPGILGLVLASLSALAALAFAVGYIAYKAFFATDPTGPPPGLLFPEGAVEGARVLLLSGGLLLLGVAAAGTRALGRWTFLPFALGLLAAAIHLFPPLASYLGLVGTPLTVLPGLGWVLLGGVMLIRATRQGAGDARSASAT